MTGAEMTSSSSVIAKYLADVLGGVLGEELSAGLRSLVLEHEVDRQPAVLVLADRRRRDLVATEQRRVVLEVGSSWPAATCVLPSGTKSSWPVCPTRRRTASTSDTPGSSMTTRSDALDDDDRLRHAGRVHAALDDVLDDAHALGGRRDAVLGQRLVLDPQAALQVEAELRVDGAPLTVRGRGVGQAKVREEVDEEGEDADDEDDDGAGSSHTGGMVHGTTRTRRGSTLETPATACPAPPWARRRWALCLEGRLDPLRERPADARHRRDLLDRRLAHPLDRAEDLEELALALRADARAGRRTPSAPCAGRAACGGT